jgi:hypothetical protein
MVFARRLDTGVPSRMFWLVISDGESHLPWSSPLVGPRTPVSPESIEIAGVKFFWEPDLNYLASQPKS